MRLVRRPHGVAAALLALSAPAALAQAAGAADVVHEVSAGAQQRRLVERAANGPAVARESGPMLRVGLAAQARLQGGSALRGELGIAGGGLDYRGQDQRGGSLRTSTGHRDLEAALLWRPLPGASWGEGWLVLRALEQRRQIASTSAAAGLHETATLLQPGVRISRSWDAAGWHWQPSLELRASVHHRLAVDYSGLFDAADLRGGRRTDAVLGLALSTPDSPWRWSLALSHARQQASAAQPLTRGGLRVGAVLQPRIRTTDLALGVSRAF